MDSPRAPDRGDPAVGAAAAQSADRNDPRRGAAANDRTAPDAPASAAAGPVAIERLWEDLWSLRAAAELWIAARRDQIRLSVRRAVVLGIAIGLAVLALAVFAASACVLLVVGIAGGVGELVGSAWLGQLLTGLVFVLGGGALGYGLVRMAQQRSRRKTLERYGKVER